MKNQLVWPPCIDDVLTQVEQRVLHWASSVAQRGPSLVQPRRSYSMAMRWALGLHLGLLLLLSSLLGPALDWQQRAAAPLSMASCDPLEHGVSFQGSRITVVVALFSYLVFNPLISVGRFIALNLREVIAVSTSLARVAVKIVPLCQNIGKIINNKNIVVRGSNYFGYDTYSTKEG